MKTTFNLFSLALLVFSAYLTAMNSDERALQAFDEHTKLTAAALQKFSSNQLENACCRYFIALSTMQPD